MDNLPKKKVVMDTNVAVVANLQATHADEDCVETCIQAIECIMDRCCIVVDNQWAIMGEYEGQLNSSGQPGVGDAFLKWLLTHLWNPSHCLQVAINADSARGYREFPNDPDLPGLIGVIANLLLLHGQQMRTRHRRFSTLPIRIGGIIAKCLRSMAYRSSSCAPVLCHLKRCEQISRRR